jgi:hypothetical protein
MFSIKDKRQDIRFTKQISVTKISNPLLNSMFCFSILEKRDFDGGGKMVERGGGAPWGYIVKKCPQ